MKILAIDTSTKFLCLGLSDNTKVYEYKLEVSRLLSTLIIQTIKRALDSLGWKVSDIDYFACGLGPGSFTGIRIGVATIKGLSWPLNKPVLGIATLDILAKNAQSLESYIMPAVDAKRGLIYTSIYQVKNKVFKRISPYMLLNEKEFLKKIKDNCVILGDAVDLYKEDILKSRKKAVILDKDYWYPQVFHIVELAKERIRDRENSDSFKVKPVYLYPKECQIRS
ncbi:MAG: tRNA (adenosine(37)-N6)-threonylcarbamoyltransferase complex dimerization subunit type 1 TsaB [Omnitrophica WOR_2 bacterium RBG_13_41_10]|nr:MAG: tRNA (adenosine(37)-N6)-threonylcarbamoyltransferase complex dimerization subunit type 1 TsaB [Omnitrophica WOR_2 bacterium RBG_13_41_10]